MAMRGKHWCFTLNNPTDDEEQRLVDLFDQSWVVYLIFGREVGENGTAHYQGFISLNTRKTLSALKGHISERIHLEVAKGSPQQAADYCKKDGDFEEFGQLPLSKQGKRTDWERLREWIDEVGGYPPTNELILKFPSLYARYPDAVREYIRACLPAPELVDGTLGPGWQQALYDDIMRDPDDRLINFVIDPDGGKGKTWFCQYMMTHHSDICQYMRVGKRDDLAHVILETKSIFLFDVPRTQMEFTQYTILEQLKDRLVFSPKYHSTMKTLTGKCHVVVFGNEFPDETKLSADRFNIINLS